MAPLEEEKRPGTEPGTGDDVLDDIKAERTQFFEDRKFWLKIGVLSGRDALQVLDLFRWGQAHPEADIEEFQFGGGGLTASFADAEAPKS